MKKSRLFRCLLPVLPAVAALMSCETKIDTDSAEEVTEIVFTSPNNGKLDLIQGESERIRYTLVPESALATAVLEWESSDGSVAGVKNGKVTAYAPGTATIQATCGKAVSEKVKVTVYPVPLTSFSVPSSVDLYVGVEQKIDVSVQPSEANAASLDWEISDENLLKVDFVEGEAILTGLKAGKCSIKVSAKDFEEGSAAETPKTISVTVTAPESRVALVYSSASKQVEIKSGDEIDWNNISGTTASGEKAISIVSTIPGLKESDLTLSSSNESVCTIAYAATEGSESSAARLALTDKGGFGSSEIRVKIADRELGLEYSTDFTLKRAAKGIPGEMVVTDPEGNEVKDGGTARIGQNSSGIFSINSGYEAKWTVTGGSDLISLTHSGGNEYWAPKAEISAGEATGQTAVTVTDQSGKSMTFTVKVTKPIFPSGIYIVDDATGKQAVASGVYVACGESLSFHLSDPDYKGVWRIHSLTTAGTTSKKFSVSSSEATNSITITSESDSWSEYRGVVLFVTDEAGEKTLTTKIIGTPRVATYWEKGYIATPDESASDAKEDYHFTWKGANTNFSTNFHLYDPSGNRIGKFPPGLTWKIIKSRDEADAQWNDTDQGIRADGALPFSWKSKHCRKVTIKVTDYFGFSVSRDIVPAFDFSDRNWVVKLEHNKNGSYIFTWLNLRYRDENTSDNIREGESGYNGDLLVDVANVRELMDKFQNGEFRLCCFYKGDLSTYQCVDIPHFVDFNGQNGNYILDSFDYAGNNKKFSAYYNAAAPIMQVALYSVRVPPLNGETQTRSNSWGAMFSLGGPSDMQWWIRE